ncbi:MAG: hemerythrin domain-containing protein [Betaproteobacteria bacterium]
MKFGAIGLIQDEHRSLAAVVQAAEFLVRKYLRESKTPDFKLLHAMLYYIREFPERRHHPKEDKVLFAKLKARTSEADAVIADLEQEHARGGQMLNALTVALSNWEAGASQGAMEFEAALNRFADFYWRHMEKEEKHVLPVAERTFSDQDWEEVESAFAANADPMLGKHTGDEFRELFTRIVRLTPAPIGLGDADT